MGNINRIILGFIFGLIPFISKAQSDDWPRFELYQLVQGQDSGIFVITDSDSNLVFTDLLKMRFFPDTAMIFNGDTIAVKPDIPTIIDGLGITIEFDPVLNQYFIESLSIEDTIHNGTASTITKGTPLYAAGIQGNYWSVAPADASDPNKMPVVIIAGENIPAGEDGLGLIKGHIKQVPTTGLPSGSEVYVAAGGGYTNVKPKGENNIIQRLGTVIKGNSTNGSGIINLGDPQATSNLNPDKIFIGAADSSVTTINLKQLISDSISTKGTVSSVAATGSNGISVTGSPITTTGTLAITSNATTLNTANTIVLRDGSGNFKAGVIEANLAGIAREVQSALTPGFGLTPSDTYNGSFARTFNVDTANATLKSWVAANTASGGVTGTFVNGSVPYAAAAGSALTNSGWYISSGSLLKGTGTTTYDFDAKGTIGGTSITASAAINGQTASFSRGASFNTDVGNYDFVVGGNALATLFRVKGSTLRVGINKATDPSYTLDVDGDVNISSGSVYRINGTALTGSQWVTSGSNIYYNSGNVGIGMTNPTSTLHVTGTITGTDDLNIDNGTFFVDASENKVGIATTSPQFPLDVVGSAMIDGSTFFVSSGDDRVGIGTGTPGYKLDVNGDVRNTGNLRLQNSNTGSSSTDGTLFSITSNQNHLNIINQELTGEILFDAGGGGTDMTLTASGNLGIGTSTNSYKLAVTGNVLVSEDGNIVLQNSTTGSNTSTDGTEISLTGSDFYITNRENNFIRFSTNNSTRLTVENNGDIYVSSLGTDGIVYSDNNILTNINPSDKKLKENINKLKYGLNEINKLNPVSFQYKDSNDKSIKFGYIAQEVKDILPEVVQEKNNGFLGMFPDKIDVVAVKAIQELYEMVLMQKKEIEQLKAELKNVKKKVKTN